MTTAPHPLDEIAIPAKTYREALSDLLTNDWNLRKQVMHAKPGEVFNVHFDYRANVPMALAKQVLADLPPMV